MVVATREIDGSNAEFGRDKGNVRKGAASSLETFAGDVNLEVGIGAIVKDGVVGTFTVKLNDEFQFVKFFGQ